MAFLMLLHEKMRLQRKVNKLTLKQAMASSRKERVTKQIEKVQKMYSKREANLEAEAKRYQNSAKFAFRQMFGLSANDFNPNSYMYGTSGDFRAVSNLMKPAYDEYGQELVNKVMSGQLVAARNEKGDTIYIDKMSGAQPQKKEENGAYTQYYNDADAYQYNGKPLTYEDFNKIYSFYQVKQQEVTSLQSQCTYMTNNYDNSVSIWLEAKKEELEAQQDEALAPLQEQETEWDLESTSAEAQLADARARLDSIKQALQDGIKDSAPTFGLG